MNNAICFEHCRVHRFRVKCRYKETYERSDLEPQGFPQFLFANRAGLNMLETTSGALQDMLWEKTLDEEGQKTIYADFTQVLQQVGFS